MNRRSISAGLSSVVAVITLGACHQAPPVSLAAPPPIDSTRETRRETHLYRGLPYGTDAEFNPVSVFFNEGFDQLRTSPRRDVLDYPYGASFAAVVRSVVRPDKPMKRYGVGNWLKDEIFPLTLKAQGGGQWYPNYTLHLFGSGLTYVRLTDWFETHGVESHPRLAAGVATYAYHFLNELTENGPTADKGVDALSDLLVFDAAAIVLWNHEWPRRLFSGPLEANTWYGQVSLGLPGRTVENAYSMFMVRTAVPKTDAWKVLITHGNVFLVGVSRRVGAQDWLTVGGGADAPANPVIDTTTGKKTADFQANAGIFYDRNGSLLASIITRGGSDNGATLNVYPGVLRVGAISPGLWVQEVKGGGVRFGIVSRVGIGVSTHAGVKH